MANHEKFDVEQIRWFCYTHYVQPARLRGETSITLKAGDIRKEITKATKKEGCKSPRIVPVRLALSKKFERTYGLKRQTKEATTYFLLSNLKKPNTLLKPSDLDPDRESWLQISSASLARAYGDDEPELEDSLGHKPQETLEQEQTVHLRSEEDIRMLLAALENPPEPNNALKDAANWHKRFFGNA